MADDKAWEECYGDYKNKERERAEEVRLEEKVTDDRTRDDGETYDLPIESGRMTPEQEYAGKERRAEIEGVVRLLPAAYRELIVLRHSHDLSYDEIAEVTALPLGTVKNRLFRAREMMRQHFIDKGITGV